MIAVPFGDSGFDNLGRMGSLESGRGPARSVQPVSEPASAPGLVSNSRRSPRSQCSSCDAVPISPPFRNAHSQTTATRQPASSRSARFRRSRSTFTSNLACQNSSRVAGVVAKRHPACLCQKQPCTKHTASNRRNTRSGVPGSFRLCKRYLRPRACRARRRTSSGLVFLLPIPAIMRDRVAWSTMSGIVVPARVGTRTCVAGFHARTPLLIKPGGHLCHRSAGNPPATRSRRLACEEPSGATLLGSSS